MGSLVISSRRSITPFLNGELCDTNWSVSLYDHAISSAAKLILSDPQGFETREARIFTSG